MSTLSSRQVRFSALCSWKKSLRIDPPLHYSVCNNLGICKSNRTSFQWKEQRVCGWTCIQWGGMLYLLCAKSHLNSILCILRRGAIIKRTSLSFLLIIQNINVQRPLNWNSLTFLTYMVSTLKIIIRFFSSQDKRCLLSSFSSVLLLLRLLYCTYHVVIEQPFFIKMVLGPTNEPWPK